jgi:hypothetical protein
MSDPWGFYVYDAENDRPIVGHIIGLGFDAADEITRQLNDGTLVADENGRLS